MGLAKTALGCFRPRCARIGAARRPKPAVAGLSNMASYPQPCAPIKKAPKRGLFYWRTGCPPLSNPSLTTPVYGIALKAN